MCTSKIIWTVRRRKTQPVGWTKSATELGQYCYKIRHNRFLRSTFRHKKIERISWVHFINIFFLAHPIISNGISFNSCGYFRASLSLSSSHWLQTHWTLPSLMIKPEWKKSTRCVCLRSCENKMRIPKWCHNTKIVYVVIFKIIDNSSNKRVFTIAIVANKMTTTTKNQNSLN